MSIVSQSRPCENVKRFDEQLSGRVDNCLQVTIAQASVLANGRNHADILRRRIDASLFADQSSLWRLERVGATEGIEFTLAIFVRRSINR